MGVNDLNLLKSWNPNLLKNKQKIWQERELLKEEDLKIKELNKELVSEQNSDSKDNNSIHSKSKGLSWMYDSSLDQTKSNKVLKSDSLASFPLHNKETSKKTEKKVLSLKDKQQKMNNTQNKVFKPNNKDIKKNSRSSELRNEDPMAFLNKNVVKRKKNSKLSREDPMSNFK